MTVQQTVARDSGPYRQGLVLGLTMAEVMLLLVFSLLIAAATLLARETERTDEARADASALAQQLAAAVSSRDELEASLQQSHAREEALKAVVDREVRPPDEWQTLVDSAGTIGQMAAVGLTPAEVVKSAPQIRALLSSVSEGSSPLPPEDVKKALDVAKLLNSGPALDMTAAEIKEAIERHAYTASTTVESDGGHKWPPIIRLSEADGHYFRTGSAELSPDFQSTIVGESIPKLLDIIRRYDVDVIEVIGHTDEQPISQRPSNLDGELRRVLQDQHSVANLVPGDNAGLGLARALSVAGLLSRDARLAKYTVLPLSAAQLIENGDRLTSWSQHGDVKERRRIEIRVRRASRVASDEGD